MTGILVIGMLLFAILVFILTAILVFKVISAIASLGKSKNKKAAQKNQMPDFKKSRSERNAYKKQLREDEKRLKEQRNDLDLG